MKFLQYIHLEHSSGFPQSIEGDPSSLLPIHPLSTWLYHLCTILPHPSDKPSNSLKSLVAMRIIYRLITIAMFYLSLHSYPPFSSPQKTPPKPPKCGALWVIARPALRHKEERASVLPAGGYSLSRTVVLITGNSRAKFHGRFILEFR